MPTPTELESAFIYIDPLTAKIARAAASARGVSLAEIGRLAAIQTLKSECPPVGALLTSGQRSEKVRLYLTAELKTRLTSVAAKADMSLSTWLARSVADFVVDSDSIAAEAKRRAGLKVQA